MKNGFKIIFLPLFLLTVLSAGAQIEKGLIPWTGKLLLNPSYAGLNRDTHFRTGLLFNSLQSNDLNNDFSLTYDTWSEKMKGGLALYFHQGLAGAVNTNTTGIGFTFSKPFETRKNSQFIPSFNLNTSFATKQWYVYIIDGLLDKVVEPPSLPGEEFPRYTIYRPGFGLLWNSPSSETGIAAWYSFYQNQVHDEETKELAPLHIVFHFTQKMRGTRKGLISEPVKTSPEVTVLYSKDLIISRVGLRMERTTHIFGVFAQNNFSDNFHGVGGVFGLKMQNFRINLLTGGTYSIPHNKPGFFGEASLELIIPYIHINKKNPWAPPPRLF